MKEYVSEFLKRSAFFQGLSADACRRLADVAEVRALAKRDILFREGESGNALFLLEKGSVQLYKTSPDGSETVIRTIGPGQVFAEVILFEERAYPVTARALNASRVLVLRRHDFLRLLDEETFRNDFIAALMRKQRYLAERVRYLTAYDVEERFRRFVHEQFGAERVIVPSISKKDMAAAIGATPETFSRLIRQLRAEGMLTWEDNTIRLSDGFLPVEDSDAFPPILRE